MTNKVKLMKLVNQAVRVLRSDGLVVFATDTVWGVGASIDSEQGIEYLYKIKQRSHTKPTAVLVADLEMAERYGVFDDRARALAQRHWPGGLTIIVPARKAPVSSLLRGSGNTIGLRVPDHPTILALLKELGSGVVSGSANIAGAIAPRTYDELDHTLIVQVDFVLWPKGSSHITSLFEAGGQLPSTVVSVERTGQVKILREGPVVI